MDESFNIRGSKIYESATEKVCARIDSLAKSDGFEVVYTDSEEEGTIKFYLVQKNSAFVEKDVYLAFIGRLTITDLVLTEENTKLVEKPGYDPYIEVEPRKEMK